LSSCDDFLISFFSEFTLAQFVPSFDTAAANSQENALRATLPADSFKPISQKEEAFPSLFLFLSFFSRSVAVVDPRAYDTARVDSVSLTVASLL
jgi:hypothetical protein